MSARGTGIRAVNRVTWTSGRERQMTYMVATREEETMSEFALSKNLESKFDDTVARLPDALATEGFGCSNELDETRL